MVSIQVVEVVAAVVRCLLEVEQVVQVHLQLEVVELHQEADQSLVAVVASSIHLDQVHQLVLEALAVQALQEQLELAEQQLAAMPQAMSTTMAVLELTPTEEPPPSLHPVYQPSS